MWRKHLLPPVSRQGRRLQPHLLLIARALNRKRLAFIEANRRSGHLVWLDVCGQGLTLRLLEGLIYVQLHYGDGWVSPLQRLDLNKVLKVSKEENDNATLTRKVPTLLQPMLTFKLTGFFMFFRSFSGGITALLIRSMFKLPWPPGSDLGVISRLG